MHTAYTEEENIVGVCFKTFKHVTQTQTHAERYGAVNREEEEEEEEEEIMGQIVQI